MEYSSAAGALSPSPPATSKREMHHVQFCPLFLALSLFTVAISFSGKASNRFFEFYNPMIDDETVYPYEEHDMPFWPMIGWFVFAFCVIVSSIEWHQRSSWIVFLNFFLSALESGLLTVALTRFLKIEIGRLRPDFNARCFDSPGVRNTTSTQCTSNDADKIDDGLRSFPSGHASTAMCIGWYISLYLLWNLYLRKQRVSLPGWIRTTLFLPSLAPFFVAIYVGATRITEFRHHPVDVVAGLSIGFFFSTLIFIRTILCLLNFSSDQ